MSVRRFMEIHRADVETFYLKINPPKKYSSWKKSVLRCTKLLVLYQQQSNLFLLRTSQSKMHSTVFKILLLTQHFHYIQLSSTKVLQRQSFLSSRTPDNTHSERGDTKLSQPLSYLIILIKFSVPARLELGVGLLSLLSPSQLPDCPDSGYKFRYDPGRMPPLAFPVGMARQFVFPPNSVMVVFPFKWFQLINNSIYPPKSSLP